MEYLNTTKCNITISGEGFKLDTTNRKEMVKFLNRHCELKTGSLIPGEDQNMMLKDDISLALIGAKYCPNLKFHVNI